jgi:DnaJ-domain-containing protein 1
VELLIAASALFDRRAHSACGHAPPLMPSFITTHLLFFVIVISLCHKHVQCRIKDSAYRTLEVSNAASQEDIRKAYKRLALKYHPDKVDIATNWYTLGISETLFHPRTRLHGRRRCF